MYSVISVIVNSLPARCIPRGKTLASGVDSRGKKRVKRVGSLGARIQKRTAMTEGGGTVGRTVTCSRWGEWHAPLPSLTATDPGTGISPLPGS